MSLGTFAPNVFAGSTFRPVTLAGQVSIVGFAGVAGTVTDVLTEPVGKIHGAATTGTVTDVLTEPVGTIFSHGN